MSELRLEIGEIENVRLKVLKVELGQASLNKSTGFEIPIWE
mgnify:CR=1 FL=1